MASDDERWYWDLNKNMAVRASERGVAVNIMGPYDSKAEAENWKSTVETRNESWDDADDEWNDTSDHAG